MLGSSSGAVSTDRMSSWKSRMSSEYEFLLGIDIPPFLPSDAAAGAAHGGIAVERDSDLRGEQLDGHRLRLIDRQLDGGDGHLRLAGGRQPVLDAFRLELRAERRRGLLHPLRLQLLVDGPLRGYSLLRVHTASPCGESGRHWPDGRGLSVASVTRFNGRRRKTVLSAVQTPIDTGEEGLSVAGRRIFLLPGRK